MAQVHLLGSQFCIYIHTDIYTHTYIHVFPFKKKPKKPQRLLWVVWETLGERAAEVRKGKWPNREGIELGKESRNELGYNIKKIKWSNSSVVTGKDKFSKLPNCLDLLI